MALACSKEKSMENQSRELPVRKAAVNPNDYEIYDYPTDYEDVLQDYLGTIENGNSIGDKSIEEAIWIMESGLNYVYAHRLWEYEYDIESKDSVSYTVDLNGSNEISGDDITDQFLEIYANIEDVTNGNDQDLLVADVRIDDVSENTATYHFSLVYVINASAVSAAEPYGGLPAVDDRQAGTKTKCGSSSGTASRFTYQYNADQAMGGYNANHLWKWGGGTNKGFSMNVVSYSSKFQTNNISESKLFGNSGSVVSAYDTPHPKAECLSESEQDTYIDDALWQDAFDLVFTADEKVLSMQTDWYTTVPFNNPPLGVWYYLDVKTGEWKHDINQSFTFEPEL